MRNRLIQLLADNRKTPGRRFDVVAAADGTDAVDVFLYEAIVADALEAEWFGGVAPEPFVKALRAITAGTINLRINSPGGSIFAARAIEQALRDHKAKVIVHIDGVAASAASFIAMAGDEIIIGKGAMFMIHKGWTYAWGNASDLTKTAALLEKIDGTLVSTYAERTGQSPADIAAWMEAETWLTAEEAVKLGFADSIADQADPQAAVPWNLQAFLASLADKAGDAPKPPADPEPVTAATEDHRARQMQRIAALQRTQFV